MELLLKLNRIRGNRLPVNYQYPLSSWIYKVIGRADHEYSTFLHEKGFRFDGKHFKMFTFSQLDLRPYKILGKEIELLGKEISLTVRFHVDSSLENFIKGLFIDQHCGLGDKHSQTDFQVTAVEVQPKPLFTQTMLYQCLSPIVVSTKRDDNSIEYLNPEDPRFGPIMLQNLKRKQAALFAPAGQQDAPASDETLTSFRLLNTPRKKGITIKAETEQETKVIAYLFNFELTAPVELHEVGYYAGFGEKNSMGMGCVGIK